MSSSRLGLSPQTAIYDLVESIDRDIIDIKLKQTLAPNGIKFYESMAPGDFDVDGMYYIAQSEQSVEGISILIKATADKGTNLISEMTIVAASIGGKDPIQISAGKLWSSSPNINEFHIFLGVDRSVYGDQLVKFKCMALANVKVIIEVSVLEY